MAFQFSGIWPWLLKMLINPLMWLLIIGGIIIFIIAVLFLRRRRRFSYPAAELVDLGNGKMGLNILKCGWIGIRIYAKGLWWTGREVMRTNDLEIIEEFSEQDFQEVNGKRGVVFYRDPISRTLIPINRLGVKGKEMVAAIPPAEFTGTAVEIIKDSIRETSDWREKVMQFVAWALVVITSLIAIIVIIQFIKNSQEKAAALIIDAGKICLESAKSICSEIRAANPGGGAP